MRGDPNDTWSVAFSPDGQWLASGGKTDPTVRLWDLRAPDATSIVLGRHDEAEGMVELSVKDPGTGMTPDVKAQVLDPFFTTKTRRLSTGLGLSLAHDIIVDGHNGTITFEDSDGGGLTVRLSIPSDRQD